MEELFALLACNTDLIKKAIDNFDWKKVFEGCDPIKQINIFTDTVFNIVSNFNRG